MSELAEPDTPGRPEPMVWQCQCGSHAFWLYSDGVAWCVECKAEAVPMQGTWCLPKGEAHLCDKAGAPAEDQQLNS